jgi:hypothetical protein
MYLNQDIQREKYLQEKNQLTSEKKSLEEKMTEMEHNSNSWLEPVLEWLKQAQALEETANGTALEPKKSAAQTICGSNLFLKNKEIEFTPEMQWAALSAAKAKIGKVSDCNILVPKVGVEPTRHCWHQLLRLARLPFRHFGLYSAILL